MKKSSQSSQVGLVVKPNQALTQLIYIYISFSPAFTSRDARTACIERVAAISLAMYTRRSRAGRGGATGGLASLPLSPPGGLFPKDGDPVRRQATTAASREGRAPHGSIHISIGAGSALSPRNRDCRASARVGHFPCLHALSFSHKQAYTQKHTHKHTLSHVYTRIHTSTQAHSAQPDK